MHLFALNESLALVSRYTHAVLQSTQASFRAQYIQRKEHFRSYGIMRSRVREVFFSLSYALRFRLCSEAVFDVLLRDKLNEVNEDERHRRLRGLIELPRRLFRDLSPRKDNHPYNADDAPLPFLHHLLATLTAAPGQLVLDMNSNDGYPLIRALHASHIPLIRFLLSHGASPALKHSLAVRIAIQKRDLALVRMLVEREAEEESTVQTTIGHKRKTSAKRRRVADRVEVTTAMLRLAVDVDARDIVEYLMDKGARPDMCILQRMQRSRLS